MAKITAGVASSHVPLLGVAVDQGKSFNEKFSAKLDQQLGSAANNKKNKDLKNVGPSVQYKLRDRNGQPRSQ